MNILRATLKRGLPGAWQVLSKAKRYLQNMRSPERVFHEIYERNVWGDRESVSGPGSNLEQTATARRLLPEFLRRVEARSLLDAPCGDFHWMSRLDLGETEYIGGDIVPALVERNRAAFASAARTFVVLDIIKDDLPTADVMLCRDCLIHLPNHMVLAALSNIKRSGIPHLVTTTFVEVNENIDIGLGGWRPINLQRPPFNLPAPKEIHAEGGHRGKSLAVWRTTDLP